MIEKRRAHMTPGRRQVFFIWTPDYTHLSSGARCLYLLCHHINRAGYEAYVTGRNAPKQLDTRFADAALIAKVRAAGADDIVIYPEVVAGNPLGGSKIVRYLLNKPGRMSATSLSDYGQADYFLHFAAEFLPQGVRSRRLRLPLVDTNVFHEHETARRNGFLIYAARVDADYWNAPKWVEPKTIICAPSPRTPEELAKLYRSSKALVTWERTAAVWEAMQCGCPTIVVPHPDFDHAPIVRRHFGCGIAVGWSRHRLALAAQTVKIAKLLYRARAIGTTYRVRRFVEDARAHFDRRDALSDGATPPCLWQALRTPGRRDRRRCRPAQGETEHRANDR